VRQCRVQKPAFDKKIKEHEDGSTSSGRRRHLGKMWHIARLAKVAERPVGR
jgi:hypothetical protein